MESIGSGVISDFHLGLMHIKSNRFTSSKVQVIFCTCFCAPFCPVNSKLHPACNLCFRTTWFATDNQLHIGSLFICFIQCFFFYAINYPFHAISVSELSGLLQTTNSTLVLYSFALCSVCFFYAINYPFHCPPYRQLSYC